MMTTKETAVNRTFQTVPFGIEVQSSIGTIVLAVHEGRIRVSSDRVRMDKPAIEVAGERCFFSAILEQKQDAWVPLSTEGGNESLAGLDVREYGTAKKSPAKVRSIVRAATIAAVTEYVAAHPDLLPQAARAELNNRALRIQETLLSLAAQRVKLAAELDEIEEIEAQLAAEKV